MSRPAPRIPRTFWLLAATLVAGAGCDFEMDLFGPCTKNCGGSGWTFAPVAYLTVDPSYVDIAWGDTVRLSVSYTDTAGTVLQDPPASWSSSDPDVATVDSGGAVVGAGIGWATIWASYRDVSAVADFTVVLGEREWPGDMRLTGLSVGAGHVCGVEDDGSLHCWGNNFSGQLALGETSRGSMVPVSPDAPPMATVTAGSTHACGLTPEGAPLCWGSNEFGTLGDGTTLERAAPTPVSGHLVLTTIAPGAWHTCGLDPDGQAWCWGDNYKGQLGTGDTGGRTSPAAVAGQLQFGTIATNLASTCALTTDGEAYCWGRSFRDGDFDPHPVPEPVAPDLHFASLDLGNARICGIDADGALWCWGNDPVSFEHWPEPRIVEAPVTLRPETLSMHAEGHFGCALDAGGAAWCWGGGDMGELGDGTGESAATPVPVEGGLRFQSVEVGIYSACGLTVDQGVWCWGGNYDGQLGTGDVTGSLVPRRVVGQP